jgi:alpha-L-fucosidase
MFIHWGLYAIPAGQWGDATHHGEWIRESAQIPLDEYEELLAQFNPVEFDADEWARTAADAGMRYLVITSKHHDGFCLFDSQHTDWDVASTPFRRDILAELSEACRRHGVRFCTYHSIMDWHHPDYLPRRGWETRSAEGADYSHFYGYLKAQVTEIIERYRPGVMWFDGEWESTWSHERGVELYQLCRALDPLLIVNNRVDVHRGGMAGMSQSAEAVGDFGTPEQEIPATGMPGVDWETCMTMNDHWGFNAHDANWKASRELIRMLVDIASKGGNFLLNVGPMANGRFPPESVERLRAIGAWMKRYGDAIYATSASPFGSLPWGRCTLKTDGERSTLYLHVFEKPESGLLVLPGLGNEPLTATFLAGPRLLLPIERRGTDVVIRVDCDLPDADCSVIALRIEGAPIVYRAPSIDAPSAILVRPTKVKVDAGAPELVVRYTLDGSEPDVASRVARGEVEIPRTCVLKARAWHDGRAVSPTAEMRFEMVAPRPAVEVGSPEPGLACDVYLGEWNALPDFDLAQPSESRIAPLVALDPGPAVERVGRRYLGFVEVERDDVYVFALRSDDGSRLWIDGERVVDNDGLHVPEERRGTIALAQGWHALRVDYFNKTGGADLALAMAPIGEPLAPVGPERLKHEAR